MRTIQISLLNLKMQLFRDLERLQSIKLRIRELIRREVKIMTNLIEFEALWEEKDNFNVLCEFSV